MKRGLVAVLAIVAIVVIVGIGFIRWANGVYDNAVKLQEENKKQWGNVQAAYQRRADLVPQLVATVKGAAENERAILTEVTQARAGIVGAQTPQDLELAGRKINTAINLAFEAYPTIRSTENFQTLQSQLEGTENRINVERNKYNETVSTYNTLVRGKFRQFALNIMDDKANFPQKESFTAVTEGAEKAPEVKF
jgi:LemA protein